MQEENVLWVVINANYFGSSIEKTIERRTFEVIPLSLQWCKKASVVDINQCNQAVAFYDVE